VKRRFFQALLVSAIVMIPAFSHALEGRTKVLSTTFPIWLLTGIVTVGDAGISNDLLIAPSMGCPHDYSVTPNDLSRMAAADVIIINGLGMDDSLVQGKNRASGGKAVVIDSSSGIQGVMDYSHGEGARKTVAHHDKTAGDKTGHEGHHHEDHFGAGHHECPHYAEHHGNDGRQDDAAGHAHEAGHVHEGTNPHLFASPLMAARIARNIARELGSIRPSSKDLYERNATAFEARMNRLTADFQAAVKRLKNVRIVTQHGAFDYLARDVGLQITAFVQDHPGYEPSAAEMLALTKTIRAGGAGAIFVEPQYPQKVPRALAAEAGIPVGLLDPVATGPAGAGTDYYEKVMRQNITALEKTLGTR